VRKALPALVVALLLCGCRSNEKTPSVLQRYDKMRRELGWITHTSGLVANDMQRLKVAMADANVSAVRTAAVRLKVDARRFSIRAGAAGNRIRVLSSSAVGREVKPYLQEVTLVLVWQWVEGVALRSLANQAWQDPLSVRGGSERRLAADLIWARKAAQRALRAASAAQATRNGAKSHFRYTVVTPAA
jgi:hypothetical protein